MMLTTSVNPGTAFAGAMPLPLLDTWAGIAGLYRDAMESSTQQLLISSANIIQEHTLRAFMEASRACADALARNAIAVQQKSAARFADANQKAMNMMGQAFIDAWMGSMRPVK
jgi:hypothetical protein